MIICWQWTKRHIIGQNAYIGKSGCKVILLPIHSKHFKMSVCGLCHCHITYLLTVSWNTKLKINNHRL